MSTWTKLPNRSCMRRWPNTTKAQSMLLRARRAIRRLGCSRGQRAARLGAENSDSAGHLPGLVESDAADATHRSGNDSWTKWAGLLLAIIGLFGAISYAVSERKKELGIRVALGARPGQLMSMVLRQTALVTGIGVGVGIVLGVAATIVFRSQLYGVGALEWVVLLPTALGMLGLSMLVAYLSARPWIAVNPMEAVRAL